tara:strand:+ start:184 stop:354 length:171 start_codon:yes stop_codon:yes gene_type:complete
MSPDTFLRDYLKGFENPERWLGSAIRERVPPPGDEALFGSIPNDIYRKVQDRVINV